MSVETSHLTGCWKIASQLFGSFVAELVDIHIQYTHQILTYALHSVGLKIRPGHWVIFYGLNTVLSSDGHVCSLVLYVRHPSNMNEN